MQIRARMSMSADGYVTTPSGWPALTADPAFVSGQSHGIREFLEGREAALMGLTFERDRALPGGSVEIVYSVSGGTGDLPARDAGWSPSSQRRG
jgi:hypothetical protein